MLKFMNTNQDAGFIKEMKNVLNRYCHCILYQKTATSSHFASSAKCKDDVYISRLTRSVKMIRLDLYFDNKDNPHYWYRHGQQCQL